MTLHDTENWQPDRRSQSGMLTEAEVRQLECLNDEFAAMIPKSGTANQQRAARRLVAEQIEQRLWNEGDLWADVKAHAVVHDHIRRDAKYRVMLDWINAWVGQAEKSATCASFTNMKLLGKGGFGAVFSAHDGQRSVAVKLAHIRRLPGDRNTVHASAQQHLAFFREARRHASINVMGCVQLFDAKSGMPEQFDVESVLVHLRENPIWFSMQLIEGRGSLRDVMTSDYRPDDVIPIDQAIRLMIGTAKILKRLHATPPPKGDSQTHGGYIIHSDFKPENILLDHGGEPWIVDFGLATPRAAQRVFGNRNSGTFPYMAPEQFNTDEDPNYVNAQTDIWAWGVVFYELVTGSLPFMARSFTELKEQIQQAAPDPPSSRALVPIPSRVESTILKCLRKDRSGENARFGSFDEVLAELEVPRQVDREIANIADESAKQRSAGTFGIWKALACVIALLTLVAAVTILQPQPLRVRADVQGVIFEFSKGIGPDQDSPDHERSMQRLEKIADDPRNTRYELELINLARQARHGAELAKQGETARARLELTQVIHRLQQNQRATNGVESYLLASARVWLGNTHVRDRRIDDAVSEYTRAIGLVASESEDQPQYEFLAKAHYARGRALWKSRRWQSAVKDFEKALTEFMNPQKQGFIDFAAEMANGVAWFAASKENLDPEKCLRYANLAVELTNRSNYSMLDTLGIAYSVNGSFDRAMETASLAIDLCEINGTDVELHAIREHKKQFERQQPVHPTL